MKDNLDMEAGGHSVHRFVRNFLLWIAKRHPKNQAPERQEYPQLWYCWPAWTKRVKWVHRLKTWVCSKLTGHEWSLTETGYSRGKHVDKWCRWCDCMTTVPREESPLSAEMEELSEQLGKEQNE